jgi:hypothetical protein
VSADTLIFVSFSDFSGTDVVSNTELEAEIGQTGSAYLWISTDDDIDTLSVANVVLTNDTVIKITGGEVFNPDILLNADDSDVGDRWDSVEAGPIAPSGDSISGLAGFSSGFAAGTGIKTNQEEGSGGDRRDALFQSSAGAFLFARVDFETIGLGEVSIDPSGIFLNEGSLDNFSVGGGDVLVSIPEPGVAVVLLGLTVVMSRRRR